MIYLQCLLLAANQTNSSSSKAKRPLVLHKTRGKHGALVRAGPASCESQRLRSAKKGDAKSPYLRRESDHPARMAKRRLDHRKRSSRPYSQQSRPCNQHRLIRLLQRHVPRLQDPFHLSKIRPNLPNGDKNLEHRHLKIQRRLR